MDSFLVMCKKFGLDKWDLEDMTIGMCLDFIETYIKETNPKETKGRKAKQSDFDRF